MHKLSHKRVDTLTEAWCTTKDDRRVLWSSRSELECRFEVCFICAQCMSFYSEKLGLGSLQLTLQWIMDDQQVALGARGHVEGAHASLVASMIVHKLKQQVCQSFCIWGPYVARIRIQATWTQAA
ncbi:hypothetical protein HanRHA438_Chr14g0632411 [Helianthus annuus]|nr:hypothetical protein HanRHA438_Chr14g0632411 [Helianthus annuus]